MCYYRSPKIGQLIGQGLENKHDRQVDGLQGQAMKWAAKKGMAQIQQPRRISPLPN